MVRLLAGSRDVLFPKAPRPAVWPVQPGGALFVAKSSVREADYSLPTTAEFKNERS